MATAPGRRAGGMRPAKGKNIKKGICENHKYFNSDTGETGDCPKCASKEVQIVDVQRLSDFKCSECGSKLTQVKDTNIANIIGICVIVAAVAVFIVGWCLGWWFGGTNEPADMYPTEQVEVPPVVEETETPEEIIEAPAAVETVNEEAAQPQTQQPAAVTTPVEKPQAASSSILGGAATMTKSGGAYTIKFNSPYTLDLGKGNGETIQLNPGDIIERADVYHDAVLRAGNLKKTSGEERYLKGLNVKLK